MEKESLTLNKPELNGDALLNKVRKDFIGLETNYKIATGEVSKRIYLDSTASTLMMGAAYRATNQFLNHYANTHSLMHFSAKISTKTYDWVHDRMLKFVNADPKEYTCFFTGSGTTAGMNRLARAFTNFRSNKDVVLISIMEHHSNDLPHRKHSNNVIHIPVDTHESNLGSIDLNLLEKYLIRYENKVNYVSITGISNVTGIINPINKAAALAHKYGAYIMVDAAQMAAHVPIKMVSEENPIENIDALVFSGHKTYAPGSPGVVIVKKSIMSAMEPLEVGGGMVDRVYPDSYFITDKFPDREEAGTPNILGAITLGSAIEILDSIGMDIILKEDMDLTNYALNKMIKIDDLVVYGDSNQDTCPRAGTISFNLKGFNHGLVAAILNDYFNIAVRNECFCAHPYVEKMLETTHMDLIEKNRESNGKSFWNIEPWMGMVRLSFGIYNSKHDVDCFINAIKYIIENNGFLKSKYSINKHGDYVHNEFEFSCHDYFTLSEISKK